MSAQNNIYRHVVFFKFHDRTGRETADAIVDAFRALCAGLPFVKGFEWGRNSSPENLNEGFTHCFIVTFGSAKTATPTCRIQLIRPSAKPIWIQIWKKFAWLTTRQIIDGGNCEKLRR